MKTFVLIVLSAFLAIVTPQSVPTPPKECCFARQFTATLTNTSSLTSGQFMVLETSLDYDKGIQGVRVVLYDPKTGQSTVTSRTVLDNNNLVAYTIIDNTPSQQCYRMPMGAPAFMRSSCMQDYVGTDDYFGSDYLGLPNAVPFDVWRDVNSQTGLTSTMAFLRDGCVPFLQAMSGKNIITNAQEDVVYLWTSYSQGIKDPSIFSIPANCFDASALPSGK